MPHHREGNRKLRNPAIICVTDTGFPVACPRDVARGAAFKRIHLCAIRIH